MLSYITGCVLMLVVATQAQIRPNWRPTWQRSVVIRNPSLISTRQDLPTQPEIPASDLCPGNYNGTVAVPGDCKRFIRCGVQGHGGVYFDCADGTLYSTRTQECATADIVDCDNGVRRSRTGTNQWNTRLNTNQNRNIDSNRLINQNRILSTRILNSGLNNQRNTDVNSRLRNQWNTALNNRLNSGLTNRQNTGLNNRQNTGLNNRLNTGLNSRLNTGLNNRLNTGLNNRLNTGLNNRLNTGLNNRVNTGLNSQQVRQNTNSRTVELRLFSNNRQILDNNSCITIEERLNAALPDLVRAYSANCKDANCLSNLPTFQVRCTQTSRGTNLFTG